MEKIVFSLPPALQLTLLLEQGRFDLRAEDLFQMAVRQNAQRTFLFVSKVLGKHLPIHPAALLAGGKLLSMAWLGQEEAGDWPDLLRGRLELPFPEILARLDATRHTLGPAERTLFLGFAETATGLARAVADCFDGEMAYVSTTRLDRPEESPLTFDESHSHARTHLLYLDPEDPFLHACQQVVLVDDELTTGNTALRLVRQLHGLYGMRRFTLMTLLDNSGVAGREALEAELGIEIQAVSLLHGQFVDVISNALPPLDLTDLQGQVGEEPQVILLKGLPLSERHPMTAAELRLQRERCGEVAAALGPGGSDTLYLGTGEFIYAPALIAGLCGGSRFHSTTQSPVYPMAGSAIVSGAHFDSPDCYSATGYLYNLPHGAHTKAVVLAEEETLSMPGLRQLTAYLRSRGVEKVTVAAL